MYDRATESLWTHFDGRAVVGVLTGAPSSRCRPLSSWADFKEPSPTAMVLDRDATGFSRPYGNNPYTGYDNPSSKPFLFRRVRRRPLGGEAAGRRRRVDGARPGRGLSSAISGRHGDRHQHGGRRHPARDLLVGGTGERPRSPRDRRGRDVGSVGVFSPSSTARTLTFSVSGESSSTTRPARSGHHRARRRRRARRTRLERIPHLDTFWFAWSTYQLIRLTTKEADRR
jgi:hypothetical protein